MELSMKRKLLLTVAGAATGMVLAFGTAQAAGAPASGLDALKTLGLEQSNVLEARSRCYRRCWRHRGHRHCRRVCRRR